MITETILFSKGINLKKSPLFLDQAELVSCSGLEIKYGGRIEGRTPVESNEDIGDGTINGIHRYDDSIVASSKALCPGDQAYFNYLYQRDISGSYSNIDVLAGNTRPVFVDYEDFMFCVDGEFKRAMIDEKIYEWGVANPEVSPAVAAGAAGNPDGEYYCYVTFYITFPNDKVVETGPSTAVDVTVSSEKIEWTGIPTCPYDGEELIIHRRLYRTVSGVAYLVTTLTDNETTSYSDDETDATLQASTIMGTSGYSTPPENMTDIESYTQRIFGIKDNKLYWSEAYSPFSFKTTSNVTVTKNEEELISVIAWGDQLYLVSKEKWRRLLGSDPNTWSIKQTFTDAGVINRSTLKRSKYGLIGLWYDGIYLFDGTINKNLTERYLGREFFDDIDTSICYAEFDGQIYSFYYGETTVDSCLKIDFMYYPELVIVNSDFVPTAHEYHKDSGIDYYGYDEDEYIEGTSETFSASLQTGDKAFENITKKKNLEYLYYDIDTGGNDVTVSFYVDGTVSSFTLTLNTSTRTRKRSQILPNMEGYRFSIKIDCDDAEDLIIYEPWAIRGTQVGD